MAAEHQLRMDAFLYKLAPFAVQILFNIEGRLEHLREGIVRDDEAQAHAGCFVFVLCVRDYAAEERGFAQTERVAADGAAVFHLRIELVLAAVQRTSPRRKVK